VYFARIWDGMLLPTILLAQRLSIRHLPGSLGQL
jgi:hypothetical protein